MFGSRFFPNRYFSPRYFPNTGAAVIAEVAASAHKYFRSLTTGRGDTLRDGAAAGRGSLLGGSAPGTRGDLIR